MAWECPNCTAPIEDGMTTCEQCGYQKPKKVVIRIKLTSAVGKSFETGIDFKIDRRVYKAVESEYRYLQNTPGSYQFELVRDGSAETGWSLRTSPFTDLNTLLNDSVCENGILYPLYTDDIIKIGSKTNPGASAAPLTVSISEEEI